jgi:hypothetical protein
MKNIAIASALMISLSLMTANAGGCTSNHVAGLCAVAHHPAKHANKKRRKYERRFGAYQR